MPYNDPYTVPDLDSPDYWSGGKAAIRGPGMPYQGPTGNPWGGTSGQYGQQLGRQGGFSQQAPAGDPMSMMWRRWYGSPAMGGGMQRQTTTKGNIGQRAQVPGGLGGGGMQSQAQTGGDGGGLAYGGGDSSINPMDMYDTQYWNRFGSGTNDVTDTNRFVSQFIHGYSPQGGPFQVGGDPNVRSFMDATMAQRARGMQGQAVTAANAAGVDPAMRQWMQMQAMMQGQGAGANALSQYAAASNTANDDLRRSMLDALMSSNLGLQRQNNQGAWQQIMANMNKPNPWDYIAGMGGRAAGGFLP